MIAEHLLNIQTTHIVLMHFHSFIDCLFPSFLPSFLPSFNSLSTTADPGPARLIPARIHTLEDIDYEIISTVILLLSLVLEGLLSVCARSAG